MYANTLYNCTSRYDRKIRGTVPSGDSSSDFPVIARIRGVKRKLGVSTVYVARSVVQHVGKDPRNFFSLHGIMRRCLRAERSGVPARLPGAWPKVPPERTVSSVSGDCSQPAADNPHGCDEASASSISVTTAGSSAPTPGIDPACQSFFSLTRWQSVARAHYVTLGAHWRGYMYSAK